MAGVSAGGGSGGGASLGGVPYGPSLMDPEHCSGFLTSCAVRFQLWVAAEPLRARSNRPWLGSSGGSVVREQWECRGQGGVLSGARRAGSPAVETQGDRDEQFH